MTERKGRSKSLRRSKGFVRDIRLIALERFDALLTAVKIEWSFHVLRAEVWHDANELNAAPYDEKFGFQSSINPESVYEAENYLKVIQTNKLRRTAERFNIVMPDESSAENYNRISWDFDEREPLYLSQKGFEQLLPAIRAAQKARREAAGFWFGIAVGIIGALTGLVAVIN